MRVVRSSERVSFETDAARTKGHQLTINEGAKLREERTMELENEPRETGNRGADHMRTRPRQPSTNHRHKLLHRRLRLLGHPILHPLDLVPLNDSAFSHLATHTDDELVRRFARALVRLLGAENGFGDERGDVVERGRREEGNQGRKKESPVLRSDPKSANALVRERKRGKLTRLAPCATLDPLSTNFSNASPTRPSRTLPSLSSARRARILYPFFCTA